MEIDKENSTFECIKFKPKKLIYEDVAISLFRKAKRSYYIGPFGDIVVSGASTDPNNAASENQCKKLLAINKLMNVAKYLNGDWKPNWNKRNDKYYIYIDYSTNKVEVSSRSKLCVAPIYFKSSKLAKQAIDILGEETIRLALSTDL